MTPADTARVLAKAAAFDQRTVGAADVASWHEVLHDLDVADALAAVTTHFRETTDRLMPAHIRRIALSLASQRAGAERRAHLDAQRAVESTETVDRTPEVAELVDQLARRMGTGDPTVLRRREWVERERNRQRTERAAAQPNPHFRGYPPAGGIPIPGEESA